MIEAFVMRSCLNVSPCVASPVSHDIYIGDYDLHDDDEGDGIGRYFLRLKRFRRVFTRYDKPDLVFSGFICFAMMIDTLLV